VFYAHTKEEPAYRLFPSEIVKLCLTLRCLRALIFLKSAKNVLKELALQGVQIVFRSKDGKPIRILAYVGTLGTLK
jgi:hypothetical protein